MRLLLPRLHSWGLPCRMSLPLQQRHLCHRAGAGYAAASSSSGPHQLTLLAPTPAAMELLAAAIAEDVAAGDCYLLNGPVGAGKSVFSRAFIRAAAGDPGLTVPSPTFLLQQVYEDRAGPPLHHYDLYRLNPGDSTARLGLQGAFSSAVMLIEWPDRLPADQVPSDATTIQLQVTEVTAADIWVSSSSSSHQGGGSTQPAAEASPQPGASSRGHEDEVSDDDDEGEEDIYQDTRCRRVTLTGSSDRTAALLARLRSQLPLSPAPGAAGDAILA